MSIELLKICIFINISVQCTLILQGTHPPDMPNISQRLVPSVDLDLPCTNLLAVFLLMKVYISSKVFPRCPGAVAK